MRHRGAVESTRCWVAFTFAIPVVYGVILTLFAHRVGTADYDQFLVFHELQYWNASLFGLAKQWAPLPWFMLIPMRGKLLPANGTGIELSVFIGPFLAYLIWRYRHTLRERLPREMRIPLL